MRRTFILVLSLAMTVSFSRGQTFESLISPGVLSRAHETLAGLDQCLLCHSPGKGVEATKCLSCHKEIAQRIEQNRGLHRSAGPACQSCHPDHQGATFRLINWDPREFSHAKTGYPLIGLHQQVQECEKCHNATTSPPRQLTRSYLLEDASCTACHEDVHRGQLGPGCERCHSLDKPFKSVQFDHKGTAFPLLGAHGRAPCDTCHRDKVWKGLSFSRCTDCHRDVHEASLGPTCQRCHTLENWKVGTPANPFVHDRTGYPLEGLHQGVACGSCHVNLRFKELEFDECRDCHADATHRGQFRQDCRSCHTLDGFPRSTFSHAQFRYALSGKHQDLACAKCHPREGANAIALEPDPGFTRYTPRPTDCAGCHADIHRAQFPRSCDACHTTAGFRGDFLTFDHERDSRYPLEGRHARTECSACHPRQPATADGAPEIVLYRPIDGSCTTCHPDYHAGQLASTCRQCHDLERFKPAGGFDHSRTTFPLAGGHSAVQCADCHRPIQTMSASGQSIETPRFKPMESKCHGCHQNPHQSLPAEECERCHRADTFSSRGYDHSKAAFKLTGKHRRISCESCHPPVLFRNRAVLTFKQRDVGCPDCHRSPHTRRYQECKRCHSTESWRVTDW